MKKIVILGAGPTGLGAAYRLQELGYTNWEIFERNSRVGGIASSFKDSQGFTWDIGGHVIFSNNDTFIKLLKKLLGDDMVEHIRESWIWTLDRFIPYPFQNNIRYLPKNALIECLKGLFAAKHMKGKQGNFLEWINSTFGKGIAKYFLVPYNTKIWAYPLEAMGKNWIAERISVINHWRILKNVILKRDDLGWGPNSKFYYPLFGGIQGLFEKFTAFIKNNLYLGKEAVEIDVDKKTVRFNDGQLASYDNLISTMPINELVKKIKDPPAYVVEASKKLLWNSIYVVGIGIKGTKPENKNWVYFPDKDIPFYRVTYLSNYSPSMSPVGCFSFLCETSYSSYKQVDKNSIIKNTIDGLVRSRIITEKQKEAVISEYLIEQDYAYPIPSLDRDHALEIIQSFLITKDIYSRGRFGAWKYEVGNMDHSVMQGVEVIDKLCG